MYTPLECIALRTTRLNDSRNLLTAWSRSHGLLTLAMPAGASKEARRRRALTAPMMVFSGVADLRPGRDIIFIRDLQGAPGAGESSPAKNMVAIFLSEILDRLLPQTAPDHALSDFLFESAETLGALPTGRALANFHIIFLYRLAGLMGIGPQLDSIGNIFDLREATFRSTPPLHPDFISGKAATVARCLPRYSYSRAHRLPLDRAGRREALDVILRFYAIHLDTLISLKSLEILRALAD